jgi:hypothetical protein
VVSHRIPPPDERGLPQARRLKGARYSVSLRVRLVRGEREITAWALNVSRGGLRAVFDEEHVDIGAELALLIGDDTQERLGRIVWTQQEPDGTIAGIEFREPLSDAIMAAWNVGPGQGSEPPIAPPTGATVDPALLPLPDLDPTSVDPASAAEDRDPPDETPTR